MPSKKKSKSGTQLALDSSLDPPKTKTTKTKKVSDSFKVASEFVALFFPEHTVQRHLRGAKHILEVTGVSAETLLSKLKYIKDGWYGEVSIFSMYDLLNIDFEWWEKDPPPPPIYTAWYSMWVQVFGEPDESCTKLQSCECGDARNHGNYNQEPRFVQKVQRCLGESTDYYYPRIPPLEYLDRFAGLQF